VTDDSGKVDRQIDHTTEKCGAICEIGCTRANPPDSNLLIYGNIEVSLVRLNIVAVCTRSLGT